MEDDNAERQENEILVLQSIYDERQFVAAEGGGGGMLAAIVELPDAFKIAYSSDNPVLKEDASVPDEEPAFEEIDIQYLPPIILSFTFPTDYPSDSPPSFKLSCKWLTPPQLSHLCQQLDGIWDDLGPGNEVLYDWMTFLTDEVLTTLDISSPLKFSKFPSKLLRSSSVDSRAVQDIPSLNEMINFLTNYDSEESNRRFNTSYYNCEICFVEKLGQNCVRFPKCLHVYCAECITDYFTIQIKDGSVRLLRCPEDKCETQADPGMVKQLVSETIYEQYEKFLLQSTLDCMDDMTYCPRTSCQSVVLVDSDSDKLGRCPNCKFIFCVFCKRTYHGVSPCPVNSKELQKLREEYLNGDEATKERLERIYGKKKLQTAVEEMYTEAWLEKFSQRCPACRTNIEKIDGCNKMHCLKCNHFFCWICRTSLPKDNPYSHFNSLNSKCFNKLFEGVEGENDFDDDEDEDWWFD